MTDPDGAGAPTEPPKLHGLRQLHVREAHKIRYTRTEWATIIDRAQASGTAPATYVRETSLGAAPKVGRAVASTAVVHELGRIGTALARIAGVASDSGALPQAAALDAAVAEVLAIIRQLG